MDEPRINLSVSLPASVHAALVREAARRTTEAGRPVGAAAVAREAVVASLGLPVPNMRVGRRPLPVSTAMTVRHRTRPTPPATA